ncbi:MAG TPA: hypothetical protein VN812_14050 [Candidatus Acidoferrales bacterium]|nr:hypothetical protein [Candidatus Acidoferrales bacterium]
MKHVVSGWLATLSLLALVIVGPARGAAQCCGTEQCAGDLNCDGEVTVDEILTVVNNALSGCVAPVSADQACADFATANCTKLDQCVLNGSTARYGGASTCVARQTQACLTRLGATGIGNTPAAVESCVKAVPAAPCSEFDLGTIPECEAKVGTFSDNAACAFSGQCQSANCAIVNGTNCGTCAPANQPGNPCDMTSCSTGLVCVGATPQCQPRGALGGSCDADLACSAGLSCVIPAGMAAGTCQTAAATLGAACAPKPTGAGCDPNAGLYCDSTTHTCLAATSVTAGAQCGFVNPGVAACTDASTCFGAQGQTPGTCKANAADGMPCDTQAGPSCIPPARCVTGGPTVTTGTCELPDPNKCKSN